MAIDSEDKRASAANHLLFQLLPVPNSDIEASDRSYFDVYCGIVTSTVSDFLLYVWKRIA